MKAPKHPNVSASIYNGEAQFLYECSYDCKYAMYHTNPPEPEDMCVMIGEGQACNCVPARLAATESLLKAIGSEVKELKEGIEA